jgi:hypothetical protein
MISRGNWRRTAASSYVPKAGWITVKTMITLSLVS